MGSTTPKEPRNILLGVVIIGGTLFGFIIYKGWLDDIGRAAQYVATLFGLLD